MTCLDQNDIYYNICADIDSDDDFELDIGYYVKLKGFNTTEEAAEALLKTLKEARITWSKKFSVRRTDENGVVTVESEGDYDSAWHSIRDEAIQELEGGYTSFAAGGGNQSLSVWIEMKSRSQAKAYRDALLRVSEEDRKILGLQDPNNLDD